MIWDLLRPTHRAEEDGVMRADPLLPVFRHHPLMFRVIIIGCEVEPVHSQFKAEPLSRLFENTHALRRDLLADAIARNDRDAVGLVHGLLPSSPPAEISPISRPTLPGR